MNPESTPPTPELTQPTPEPSPAQTRLLSGFNPESEMIKVRESFAPVFTWVVVAVLILIGLSVVATLVVLFAGKSSEDTLLFVRLLQITFGMILGSSCVFFGVILSWLGITAVYSFNASADGQGAKGNLSVQNVTPGIVLILSGAILIGASLYKPVDYHATRTQELPYSVIQTQPQASSKNVP